MTGEQSLIRQALHSGEDMQVVAHAGAGKTSALLWSLVSCRKKTLFLEYNRELKENAQAAAQLLGLDGHVWVTNYDSLLTRAYAQDAPTRGFRTCMQEVCMQNVSPAVAMNFERLVLDEAQDLTPMLAGFTAKVLLDIEKATGARPQLVMAGDPKQTVYAYRGATPAYLFCRIGPFADCARKVTLLGQSHRVPEDVCRVVESVCGPLFTPEAWGGRMRGRGGAEGSVSVRTASEDGTIFAQSDIARILRFVAAGAKAAVAVLAYSLRASATLLRRVVAELGKARIPLSDENCGSAAQVSTIHTSKGCEWELVVVVLDAEWTTCASGRFVLRPHFAALLYVAMTRTRSHLVLVQEASSRVLAHIWSEEPTDPRVLQLWMSARRSRAAEDVPREICAETCCSPEATSLLARLRRGEGPSAQRAVAALPLSCEEMAPLEMLLARARAVKAVAVRLLCVRGCLALAPHADALRAFGASLAEDASPAVRSRVRPLWWDCSCPAEHWCRHFLCDWRLWDALADLLDPGAFYGTLLHVPPTRADLAAMGQLQAALGEPPLATLGKVAGRVADALSACGCRNALWTTNFLPAGGCVLVFPPTGESGRARALVMDWAKAGDDNAERRDDGPAACSAALAAFCFLLSQQGGGAEVEVTEIPTGRRTLFRAELSPQVELEKLLRAFRH